VQLHSTECSHPGHATHAGTHLLPRPHKPQDAHAAHGSDEQPNDSSTAKRYCRAVQGCARAALHASSLHQAVIAMPAIAALHADASDAAAWHSASHYLVPERQRLRTAMLPSLLLLPGPSHLPVLVLALHKAHQRVAVLKGGHVAQAGAHGAQRHLQKHGGSSASGRRPIAHDHHSTCSWHTW
jgi:hypothetical protein